MARVRGNVTAAKKPAQQHRIAGSERRAEDRGPRRRKPQHQPSGERNEGGGKQRTWPEQPERQPAAALHFGDIERDGVRKEHERETQSRHYAQRRGVEPDIEHAETEVAERRAEREKHRDLRQPAALNQPGKQSGHDNDYAYDRERGG